MERKFPGTDDRIALFKLNMPALEALAHRSIHTDGLRPDEFVVAIVDLSDPTWTRLIEEFIPEHDWEDEQLIMRCLAPADRVVALIKATAPSLREIIDSGVGEGEVFGFVLAFDGASLAHITPKPHAKRTRS